MTYRLFLSRAELDFLAVAVEERKMILDHFLNKAQDDPADQIPFYPDPLTDEEKESMRASLERSEKITEKIQMLQTYALLSVEAVIAKNKADKQKQLYLAFATRGISPEPDLDDLDLEIPDPE